MKAAPSPFFYLGNVYIKNLSASFPQLVKRERKRERDPLTRLFSPLFPPASPFYLSLSITRLGYFESEPHFWGCCNDMYVGIDGCR